MELLTKWSAFKKRLEQNANLVLQFQYGGNNWIHPSYHITEIKQAQITSVDCGGKINKWTEVIVQVWEPASKTDQQAMKVDKALSIIALVEKNLSIDPEAVVKIEFGNETFDTRQMYPNDLEVVAENLVIDLIADKTQCKALQREKTCGPGSSCC